MSFRALVLVLLALGMFMFGVRYVYGVSTCAWYGHQTEREVRYSGFVGCMVKTTHGWTPRTELRSSAE